MKVIDTFCFLNELDLLELRLNELNDVVDKHVIIEANFTSSNKPKAFVFEENRNRFDAFKEKIIYRKVYAQDKPQVSFSGEERHDLMFYQRQFIKEEVEKIADETDLILFSDLDEIPKKQVIASLVKEFPSLKQPHITLVLRGFFWYFNCRFVAPQNHVWFDVLVVSQAKDFKNADLKWLRLNNRNFPKIHDAGWHFSHCGPVGLIRDKMLASSHVEYSSDHYTLPENIHRRRMNRGDPYDRPGFSMTIVPVDESFPEFLLKHKEKYKEFIYE